MSDLTNKLAARLGLPATKAHMISLGLFTEGYMVTVMPTGVEIKHPKNRVMHDYDAVSRALLVRLMADKDAMMYNIRGHIETVILGLGGNRVTIIDPVVEGDRIHVQTTCGARWRLNTVTFNVTKYIGGHWIIQNNDKHPTELFIKKIHAILIQVGMMSI